MDEEQVTQEPQENIPEIPDDWAYPQIYQPIITLGDGTELNGTVTKSVFSNRIWVMLKERGLTYSQIIAMFNDPVNTRIIRYSASASERTEYIGYTYLSSIDAETDGKFNVALAKPDT